MNTTQTADKKATRDQRAIRLYGCLPEYIVLTYNPKETPSGLRAGDTRVPVRQMMLDMLSETADTLEYARRLDPGNSIDTRTARALINRARFLLANIQPKDEADRHVEAALPGDLDDATSCIATYGTDPASLRDDFAPRLEDGREVVGGLASAPLLHAQQLCSQAQDVMARATPHVATEVAQMHETARHTLNRTKWLMSKTQAALDTRPEPTRPQAIEQDEAFFKKTCNDLYGLDPDRMKRIYTPTMRAEGMTCGLEHIPARRLIMDTLWRASGQVYVQAIHGDDNAEETYQYLNRAIYMLDELRKFGNDSNTEPYEWAGGEADHDEVFMDRFGVDELGLRADIDNARKPDKCWRHIAALVVSAHEVLSASETRATPDRPKDDALRLTNRAAYVIAEMIHHDQTQVAAQASELD